MQLIMSVVPLSYPKGPQVWWDTWLSAVQTRSCTDALILIRRMDSGQLDQNVFMARLFD